MLITSFIRNLTGVPVSTLFGRPDPQVVLQADADNHVSIVTWNVPNVPEPTQAQLDAAAALPEPSPPRELLIAYAEARQVKVLAAGVTVNVAASGSPSVPVLCDGTTASIANLSLLGQWGQQNPTGTKTWVDNNNVGTVLTGAEIVNLVTLVGNWVQSTYPDLYNVINGITAQPATITTYAQIDAARMGVVGGS